MITEFDKSAEFAEIKPKMEELIRLCYKHNVPMFVLACINSNEKDTKYVADAVIPSAIRVELKHDHIRDMIKVLNDMSPARPRVKMLDTEIVEGEEIVEEIPPEEML